MRIPLKMMIVVLVSLSLVLFVSLFAPDFIAVTSAEPGNSPAEAFDPEPVATLLELVLDDATGNEESARQCLGVLAGKIQSREVTAAQLAALRKRLDGAMAKVIQADPPGPLRLDAAFLATTWGNSKAAALARDALRDPKLDDAKRLAALGTLVFAGEPKIAEIAMSLAADTKQGTKEFRGGVLAALARSTDGDVGRAVLAAYSKLEPELQSKAIELLTQRAAWSKALLEAVGRGDVAASAINVNQVRRLLASSDAELVKAVRSKWGSLRTDRDPKREQVIAEMRQLVKSRRGDPHRGQAVFGKVCGQCHQIHGQGSDVGPDITSNGRASFEQLLSNVFDPSLVIGASYQAVQVVTTEGRVLTGLVAEDSPDRIVLKVQGGKLETVPRDEVDVQQVSKLSLMPEELEKQLKPEELVDLLAYLSLDKPPADPQARPIPGTPK